MTVYLATGEVIRQDESSPVANRLAVAEAGKWPMARKRKGFFLEPVPPLYLGEWLDRLGKRPVDVAKGVGVSQPYLSELIAGRTLDKPSSHLIFRISEFLGVTVNDLYRRPPTREAVAAAERATGGKLPPHQIAALGRLLEEMPPTALR